MVHRTISTFVALALGISLAVAPAVAAEKVRFGVGFKPAGHLTLPVWAAEEKGIWDRNGLEVKTFFFRGGMSREMAGGALDMGYEAASSVIRSASRGGRVLILASQSWVDFFFWVRSDSRIRRPEDLRGAVIGTLRLGGMNHAYGLMVARKLGLERDIKLVALGGGRAEIAALKAGKIDSRIGSFQFMAPLKFRGEVRQVLNISGYFPKEWLDNTLSARRDFIKQNPDATRRAVKASLQAANFLVKNPDWAIAKMKKEFGYSTEVAKSIFPSFRLSLDGRVSRQAVDNVRNFLIAYKIIPREKALPVEKLYTTRFLP